jgi:hypothetical protein
MLSFPGVSLCSESVLLLIVQFKVRVISYLRVDTAFDPKLNRFQKKLFL